MAYSRWTNDSFWYCFRAKNYSPNLANTKEHQIFEIVKEEETSIYFYPLLKNARNECLEKIQRAFNANDAQMDELELYINEFLAEVESDFVEA